MRGATRGGGPGPRGGHRGFRPSSHEGTGLRTPPPHGVPRVREANSELEGSQEEGKTKKGDSARSPTLPTPHPGKEPDAQEFTKKGPGADNLPLTSPGIGVRLG